MLDTADECMKERMTYHVVVEVMNGRGVYVSGVVLCAKLRSSFVLCAEYLAVFNLDGEE